VAAAWWWLPAAVDAIIPSAVPGACRADGCSPAGTTAATPAAAASAATGVRARAHELLARWRRCGSAGPTSTDSGRLRGVKPAAADLPSLLARCMRHRIPMMTAVVSCSALGCPRSVCFPCSGACCSGLEKGLALERRAPNGLHGPSGSNRNQPHLHFQHLDLYLSLAHAHPLLRQ
jgi:hypothetical protein